MKIGTIVEYTCPGESWNAGSQKTAPGIVNAVWKDGQGAIIYVNLMLLPDCAPPVSKTSVAISPIPVDDPQHAVCWPVAEYAYAEAPAEKPEVIGPCQYVNCPRSGTIHTHEISGPATENSVAEVGKDATH